MCLGLSFDLCLRRCYREIEGINHREDEMREKVEKQWKVPGSGRPWALLWVMGRAVRVDGCGNVYLLSIARVFWVDYYIGG